MMNKNNPPVFPTKYIDTELRDVLIEERMKAFEDLSTGLNISLQNIRDLSTTAPGISLLELYAGFALIGRGELSTASRAKRAWEMAESMMEERNRRMK